MIRHVQRKAAAAAAVMNRHKRNYGTIYTQDIHSRNNRFMQPGREFSCPDLLFFLFDRKREGFLGNFLAKKRFFGKIS